MTDNTTTNRDPAEIERDIRQTQNEMSRTVDKIGDQLTARNIINGLLDKADANDIDARKLIDMARRNPLALAMIGGGAIWLVSDSDAKMPSVDFGKLRGSGRGSDSSDHDPHHREYTSHMAAVEWRDGEDPAAYQRRRDYARANYLMVERRHDEDDNSFRQRLDDAGEKFRQQRRAWAERGHQASDAARRSTRNAMDSAQQAFMGNPLVGGLAAAAVGAVLGSLLPLTETEEDNLSGLGEKARSKAGEQKDRLTEAAREKKDELVHKAEDASRPRGSDCGGQRPGAANDGQREDHQLAASQQPTRQTGGFDETSAGQGSQSGAGTEEFR